jgi:large subunit ribosomal protein L25
MAEITLKAQKREQFKKSISKALRKSGFVPGIVYGHNEANIPIKATELSLRPIVFSSEAKAIKLEIEGETQPINCILKDTQFDPISGRLIHFDLLTLKAGEKITIEVPVILKGTAIGVKEGGLLQHILHKLEVECSSQNIIPHIDVDITNLQIGDSIKVSDIKIEGVRILNDETSAIVAVIPPTVTTAEAEAATTTPETAEPEVIGKGKKEETEES